MVSKASDDFPLPLGPVTTLSFPSGRSRSMPLRLFWRAPRISTHPRSAKALTMFFSPLLEPTGDNRFTRCGLQILWNRHPFAGVIPSASEGPHSSPWRRSRSPSPSARFGMTEWKRKRNRQRVSGLESRGKLLALLVQFLWHDAAQSLEEFRVSRN